MFTKFRAHADSSCIAVAVVLVAALTFTPSALAAQIPSPSITVTPTTVAPGATVTVTVANGPGSPTDWVALYPAGAPSPGYLEWKYLNESRIPPAAGLSGATVTFTVPTTPGAYDLRFMANNGFTFLADATVTTVSPIAVSPTTVIVGGTVTVTITNGPGGATDWVALYQAGAPNPAYLEWKYLNGFRIAPPVGVTGAALTFTLPATPGAYDLRFFANNDFVLLGSAEVAGVISDATPPVIAAVAASAITVSGATITWTTNEASDSQVDYGLTAAYGSVSPLDGSLVTAHTVNLSGLTGSALNHYRVRSRDAAGNLALSGDVTFITLDGTAPTVALTAPAANATVSGAISVSAIANDNIGVAGVQFRLDGAALGAEAVTAPYAMAWDTTTATDGSHILTAVARDAATNQTTSAAVSVTVANDTTAPVIAAVAASSITVSGATISWTTNEASDSQVDYGLTTAYGSASVLNGIDVMTHTENLSGLNGSTLYHYRVRSRDAAGNLALSADVTFTTVDSTAPTVALTAPAANATVSGTTTVSATASDNVGVAGVQFRLDGAVLGAEDVTAPYTVAWNTTTATEGSHTLTAVARDAATNQTTSTARSVIVDTTAPVIAGVATSAITLSGATISWTTNEASNSQVNYGLTTAYGSASALNASQVTAHAVVLSGLAANTTYHYRVRSRDAAGAGNLALSGDFILTTLADVGPPTVALSAPVANATVSGTTTVSATASDNVGVAGVQFQLEGAVLGAEDVTAPYTMTWDTTTAINGSHTLTAVARDAATNQTTSAAVSVTVANDTTPPVIAAVAASAITASGATITWTTNEASDSQVDYGLTVAYGSASALNTTDVTAHTIALSGLAVSTTYHYRVRSRDAANNLATSGDFMLTTGDSTAPTVALTAPAANATVSGALTVSATASDDVGVAGVEFRLDGVPLGAEALTAPYAVSWNTQGSADLLVGAVITDSGPVGTISPGSGFTKRLTLNGEDTITEDKVQPAAGAAAATFTLSAAARYLAQMAAFKATGSPAYAQGAAVTSNVGGPTLASAFAANNTAGNLIVVVASWGTAGAVSATDSQGNVYAVATTAFDAVQNQSLAILYAANVRAGANTVTASFGGIATFRRLEILEYAGMATANVLDVTAANIADGTTTVNTITSGSATTTMIPPVSNGSHTLTAQARDAAGNTTVSAAVTVTVDNAGDTTPPVIAAVAASAITAAGATIGWTTNEASDSQVDYGLTTAYGSASALNNTDVTAHMESLSGLTGSTLYHARVRSRDAAGNLALSGDITFTTLDGTAPTVALTAPAANATVSGTTTVSATASDNIGVAGVQFQLDGAVLGAEDVAAPYTVAWNTTTATDGVHTLTAVARDAATNQTTSAAVSVTVDTTAPVITAVAASSITLSGATIGWTTNEASNSQVNYGLTTAYGSSSALNASQVTAHSIALSGLAANTTYHYRVRSRDAAGAGNLALSGDFTVTTLADGTAPTVALTAPAANATVSGTTTVSATASDNVGVAGVQFRLDGAVLGAEDVTAPYAVSWDPTTATNGLHTLTAVARDAATNQTTSAAVSVTVANGPPPTGNLIVAYTYDEGAGTTAADGSGNNNTATVSGTSWSTACQFGGCLAFNGTNGFVETPDVDLLTPGVDATFEAWVVLTAAPTEVASIFNKWTQLVDDEYLVGVNPDRTLTFNWHTTGGDVYRTPAWDSVTSVGTLPLNALTHIAVVRSGATVTFYINAAPETPRAVMDTNPFHNGPSTLRVGGQGRGGVARFFAGRIDEVRLYAQALTQAEVQRDMTTTIGVDVTPPVLSAISASPVTSSGATITWTTNEASDSQVDYGLTTAYGSASALNNTDVTAHTVNLSGLTGSTLYHVRVRSRDAAGNLALSGDLTFTTLSGADVTPPTVAITAPSGGATVAGAVTMTATASDNVGVAGVQFRLDGAVLGAEDVAAPYAVTWDTTTASNGLHTLTAVARDAATNQTTSAVVSVTVANDTTPPVMAAVAASAITAAGATIGWTTNEASDSQVDYGLTTAYGSASALNNTDVTAHTVNLSGLSGSTLYHVRVRSRDAAGNLALSGDITFTTLDGTAPTVALTAPAANATVSGTTTVSATASDNVGVAGVQFRLDGAVLGAEDVAAPYAVTWDTTTASNGLHTLTAVARDAATNQTTSAVVSVTVANDTTPPVMAAVAASAITAAGATIGWTTNEASDSQVDYGLTTAYGSASALNNTDVTAHTVNLSGLSGSTLYHVRVRSRDAAGNLALSGDITFTTLDGTAPTVALTAPAANATVSGTTTVSATASDNVGVAGVQFRLDGAVLGAEDVTAPYAVSWDPTTATNGLHTLTAVARDAATNQTTSAAVSVTVANGPPPTGNLIVAYTYDEGAGTTAADGSGNNNTATVSGTSWSTACQFGGCLAFNGTNGFVETPDVDLLTPGVDATFEAWVVLTAAPTEVASIFNKWTQLVDDEYLVGVNPDRTLTFNWHTTGGDVYRTPAWDSVTSVGTLPLNALTHIAVVRSGATVTFYINAAPETPRAVMDTNPFHNGPSTLRVGGQGRGGVARFFAGRIDEVRLYAQALTQAEVQRDMTTTIGVDVTPPVLSAISASPVTSSGATITWTTNEASDSQVDYGLTTAYGSASALNNTDVTAHTVNLSGLTGSTLYHVRVRSRDAAGNLALSGDLTFTTLSGADVTPPTVAITAPSGGATVAGAVTMTATASDNVGVAGVQFRLDGAVLGAEDVAAPYAVTWDTTTASNGLHTLTAVARDAATNQTTSAVVSVTVANDTTPPVMAAVAASAITAAGATIGWTTNEASDSQVDYGLTTAYGSASALNNTDVTAHTVNLSGLSGSTLYHVRVRSRDAAGNLALSGDITFTTLDGTAPTVALTAPAANATVSGTTTVSATASDNVGVAGVQFRLDGAVLGAEDVTAPYAVSWDPTTATNGLHTLTAVARDAATNQTTSAAVSVTVANGPPPTGNLIVAYTYDEGAGTTAADGSGNNNTATVSGTSWSTACQFGGCLAFNGTNGFVETPDVDLLTPGVDATFEAWVVLTAAPTEVASIFNKWTQLVDDEYLVGVNPDRTLTFNWHTTGGDVYRTPAWDSVTSVGTLPLNALTHIAVVRSGATVTFYINAAPETPRAVMDTNPFHNGPSTLRVGGQGRGGVARFFAGRIDEVRLYAQALTQAEVQRDMTTTIGVDVTPPVLSAISASAVTSSGATIRWTTNEASDSQVDYGLTTAYGSISPLNGSLVTTHAVILGALAGNTTYHVRARSKDAAGNLALSGDFAFTTSVVDPTPPVVSITAPAANATVSGTTTFSATATDNVGVAGVEFKLDGVLLAPEDTAAPYTLAWDTTTAANGSHTLTAVAWDAAGNSATATRTVTVSNVPAQVNLAWNANTESDLAGYKVYVGTASGVYSTTYNVGNVIGYTVAGLAPGDVYYFVVTAYDTGGLESLVSNEVSAAK